MHLVVTIAALLAALLAGGEAQLYAPGADHPASITSAGPNGLCVWQGASAAQGPRGMRAVGCYRWSEAPAAAEAAWARRIVVRVAP